MAGWESGVRAIRPRYRFASPMSDSNAEPQPPTGASGINTGADGEPPLYRRSRVVTWVAHRGGFRCSAWSSSVVLSAGFLIHLPYVIISPGFATPLDKNVVAVDGAQTYAQPGNVLFLTVRVTTHDPTRVAGGHELARLRIATSRSAAMSSAASPTRRTTHVQHAAHAAVAGRSQGCRTHASRLHGRCGPAGDHRRSRCARERPHTARCRWVTSVLAVDGQAVNQLADVAALVQQHQPGEAHEHHASSATAPRDHRRRGRAHLSRPAQRASR